MDTLYLVAVVVYALIILLDLLPYLLACAFVGQILPEGPYVWQFLRRIFRKKPRYATWEDIP